MTLVRARDIETYLNMLQQATKNFPRKRRLPKPGIVWGAGLFGCPSPTGLREYFTTVIMEGIARTT
jgi:hypothetical protein